VLPDRIELSTSPLPRECSTTELRQQGRRVPRPRRAETATRGGRVQGKSPGPRQVGVESGTAVAAPRHRAPTMRPERLPMADATAVLPLPLACGGGWGGGRGGATASARLKTSAISSPQLTPASGAGGGLRLRSTPKVVLAIWRYRWISTLHGVVPPKIAGVRNISRVRRIGKAAEGQPKAHFLGAGAASPSPPSPASRGRESSALTCRPGAPPTGLPRLAASLRTEAMTHRRSEEDQERLAAALRANLARRKAQARQRREDDPRQRQEGDPRQRQEGDPRQRHEGDERQGPLSRPSEGPLEPDGAGAPDGPGEGTHDSAGFVGDKP
jgi:hypothetical protein